MPNLNAPNGFKLVGHMAGGVPARMNEYRLASGTANAIFTGDPVIILNTGLLDRAGGTSVNIIGIFAGVRWIDVDGTPRFSRHWPAAQVTQGAGDAFALVCDDPMAVFEVQCKTGTAFAQTHVGNNADYEYVAGNTLNGSSNSHLDISAAGAATAQFRILGLAPLPNNDFGDSARVRVSINEHLNRAAAGI